MTRFASTVREHRLAADLSQEALARELGVSRQTIVNVERGDHEPRVLLALRLSKALDTPVDVLFGAVAEG